MESFEQAKSLLKKADKDGRTLYDHLSDVLLTISKEQPEYPLKDFETISVRVKENATRKSVQKEFPATRVEDSTKKALLSHFKQVSELCKPTPKADDDGADEEPTQVPDLLAQSRLLEWSGIQLGVEATSDSSANSSELRKTTLSLKQS